jgi:hypothetical protein
MLQPSSSRYQKPNGRKLSCSLCRYSCYSAQDLQQHNKSALHPVKLLAQQLKSFGGHLAWATPTFRDCMCRNEEITARPSPTHFVAPQAAGESNHVPNKPKRKFSCSLCNESFESAGNLRLHNNSGKHKVNLLAQQLRTSGSFHANLQGLQVSEFEDVTNLEVGRPVVLGIIPNCQFLLVKYRQSHSTLPHQSSLPICFAAVLPQHGRLSLRS